MIGEAANCEFHDLVKRCLDGDQHAMLELVERYQGQVYGLCFRMLGQRQDAEDMTQETFVRVLKNLDRWDPTRDFTPWLMAIAGNRCRTCLSKRMRMPFAQHLDQPIPERNGKCERAGHLEEEMELALAQIRTEYRLAFQHFHVGGLSYGEIAEAMDVPLGTVKTWVHRARKEIIQQLVRRGVVEDNRHELRSI